MRAGIALVLLSTGLACHAQQPLPLAEPNLNLFDGGVVSAYQRMTDGGLVVGGSFTGVEVAGGLITDRSYLARFKPDGTLDLAWNPVLDGPVAALAVDASGSVYAVGSFFSAGGMHRIGAAKFSASGALDTAWNAGISGCQAIPCAAAVVLDETGNVFLGGAFTTLGGLDRNGLAKLSSTNGAADANWDPQAKTGLDTPARIYLLARSGSDLIASGTFQSIGGQPRAGLARLTAAGIAAVAWNPAPDGPVQALALDSDGSLFVGGLFSQVGGQARYRIAKLAPGSTGAADSSWAPGLSTGAIIQALAPDGAGNVYVGGRFSTIGGITMSNAAKLSATGAGVAEAGWNAALNRDVQAIAFDGYGNVVVGGGFRSCAGAPALGYARLKASDGAVLSRAQFLRPATVYALARGTDGSLFVGGRFVRANALERLGVLKLRPDRTLDPDWSVSIQGSTLEVGGSVLSLAVDADSLYVGGSFDRVGDTVRLGLARVSASTGSLDAAWNPGGRITRAIAVVGSDVFVGGTFTTIGGLVRSNLAKLYSVDGAADPVWAPLGSLGSVTAFAVAGSSLHYASANRVVKLSTTGTGALDPGWDASDSVGLNDRIDAIAVSPDGTVLIGGNFLAVRGITRYSLARLQADGSVDPAWVPPLFTINAAVECCVRALAIAPDNSVFAGGYFSSAAMQHSVARLSPSDGAILPGFDPAGIDTPFILALALDPSGIVWLGGDFTRIGDQPRRSLVAYAVALDRVYADGFE